MKCEEKHCQTLESLIESLKEKVSTVYEKSVDEEGEGRVIYICGTDENK